MKTANCWQKIRENYHNSWLLLEAIAAHSENNKRVIDEIIVVEKFLNSNDAMKKYILLHRNNPIKEYYIAHTDKIELDIEERKWLGIRQSL